MFNKLKQFCEMQTANINAIPHSDLLANAVISANKSHDEMHAFLQSDAWMPGKVSISFAEAAETCCRSAISDISHTNKISVKPK